MDFIKQMFAEGGTVSEMRVMAMLSLIVGAAIAFIGMNKPNIDFSGITMLSGLFVGAAFGGKVMQKRTEIEGKKTTTVEESNQ